MAQFDVYANPSKTSRGIYPYLLDIQSPYLGDLATRIVIPLGNGASFGGQAMQRLTPKVMFHDQELLLLVPQIASIPAKQLKSAVGSLAHFRDRIIGALDFATTGI